MPASSRLAIGTDKRKLMEGMQTQYTGVGLATGKNCFSWGRTL